MTANEYANLAMKVLKDGGYTKNSYYGYGLSTPRLASSMHVADTSRDTLLKVMEKLALLGRVRKSGTGKYVWQLVEEDWDESRPFAKPESQNTSYSAPQYSAPTSESSSERETELNEQITELRTKVQTLEDSLTTAVKTVEEKNAEIKSAAQSVKTLKIERYDGSKETIKDVVLPPQFDTVKDLAECRQNILLVGPAGCGKSHLAEVVAKVLGLGFGSISCTSGMSEAHLLGRSMPDLTNGDSKFHTTDFLDCYENGGVFLFDELDAADPNLLLCVNTALANGYCNVPSRPKKSRAKKHVDFVCIATANTFGRGANRVYAGRNQLDEATLDRFRIGIVEMDYCPSVEKALCPDDTLRTKLQKTRERIVECGLTRRVLSTRFLAQAYTMMSKKGWTVEKVMETFYSGWPKDERTKVEYEGTTYNPYYNK